MEMCVSGSMYEAEIWGTYPRHELIGPDDVRFF